MISHSRPVLLVIALCLVAGISVAAVQCGHAGGQPDEVPGWGGRPTDREANSARLAPRLNARSGGQWTLEPRPGSGFQEFSVRGVVKSEAGELIGEGFVYRMDQAENTNWRPTEVAPDGRFQATIEAQLECAVWLFHSAEGKWCSVPVKVHCTESQQIADVEILSAPMYRCTVRVVDPAGRVVADARVEARGSALRLEGSTDASGEITFWAPAHTLGFWVNGPDGSRGQSRRALRPGAQTDIVDEIRLGKPWLTIPLFVTSSCPMPEAEASASVTVTRQGRNTSSIVVVNGDPWRLEVPRDTWVDGTVDLGRGAPIAFRWRCDAGEANPGIVVRVPDTRAPAISFVSTSGSPLPCVNSSLRPADASADDSPPSVCAVADVRGRVNFGWLGCGLYDLTLTGRRDDPVAQVQVQRDAPPRVVVLEGMGIVAGTAAGHFDQRGGSRVFVRLEDEQYICPVDATGAWAVAVPANRGEEVRVHLVQAGMPPEGCVRACVGDMDVAVAANPTVDLLVELLGRDGKHAGGTLKLTRRGGGSAGVGSRTAIVAANTPHAVFRGLELGEYEVAWRGAADSDHFTRLSTCVVVGPNSESVQVHLPGGS